MASTNKNVSVIGIFTALAVGLYLLGVILSDTLILYGIHKDCDQAFVTGNRLVYAWILNPIPLGLSVYGLKNRGQHKTLYRTCIILTTAAWLIGGAVIA